MKQSSFRELVAASRTIRRFQQDSRVGKAVLRRLIDLARLSPSGGNKQPLKYILSSDSKRNEAIFPCLAWAGYFTDWPGPSEGERPAAYIILLLDTAISTSAGVDHGIAAQSIMLGAAELGLGGCIIGSIDRERLRKELRLPARYEILLVLALGKPKELVKLEPAKQGEIKYWRDKRGLHHVPKRPLRELILDQHFQLNKGDK